MLRERFLAQPDGVRGTLRYAALLHRPTVRQLERAGRLDAEEEVRRGRSAAGLLARSDDACGSRRRLWAGWSPRRPAAACRAAAAPRPGRGRDRRARSSSGTGRWPTPGPDADLARALGVAAGGAGLRGARELATELYLLAADRAPVDLAAERVEWLATAVETGALGNHAELVHRALDDFLEPSRATPAQRVRVRLALVELAGPGVAAMDEVLTAALADAGDDPRWSPMVLLQRARVQLMESRPAGRSRTPQEAVGLLAAAATRQARPWRCPSSP